MGRSRMSCPVLETRLVKPLWIEFTKKMLSKGETSTRPCVKFVKAIPNDVWINSKICKRLLCVFTFKIFRQIEDTSRQYFIIYSVFSCKATFEIYQLQHH